MALSPTDSLQRRRQRALDRARELKLYDQADGDRGYLLVPSTSTRGKFYEVRIEGDSYKCNCAAGKAKQDCVHAAACWLVITGWNGQHVILREPVSGTSRTN